jgi:hypothetical protein
LSILECLLLFVLLFFFIVFKEHSLILHILSFIEHLVGFISIFDKPWGLVDLDFPDVGILDLFGLALFL